MKPPEEYTDEARLSSENVADGGVVGAEAFQNEMPAVQDGIPLDKVLLLGEQNPYGGDPSFALYPAPDGCAGHRLCCRVLKLGRNEYLRRFDRANVLNRPGSWAVREARAAASKVLERRRRVVALGAKVAGALGLPTVPFEEHRILLHGEDWRHVLVLPHPSGLCRVWNMPGAFERAREMVFALESRAVGGRP